MALKLASLLFFAQLVFVHHVCGAPASFDWPMSGFRDGECAPMGYVLFGALGLVLVVYSVDLGRFKDPSETVDTIGFGLLLLMVAISPNQSMFHRTFAFLVLGSAYVFFAIQLRSNRALMAAHICAPAAIAVVLGKGLGFESYAIWQKTLISYFVVVATVHHHFATRHVLPI